jgi:hypothetical protein
MTNNLTPAVSTSRAERVSLVVRLSPQLREEARLVANQRGETLSGIVRAALAAYVQQARAEAVEGPDWGHDSILDIVGLGAGGPPDLSSNKYAYFTEAFS